MLERLIGSQFDAACDSCAAGAETVDAEDFYEAAEQLRAKGWKIVRHGGEYEHTCPDCQSAASEFEPIP